MPKLFCSHLGAAIRSAMPFIFCTIFIMSALSHNMSFVYKVFIIYCMFLFLKNIKSSKTNKLAKKIVLQYSQMQTIINNISVALYLKDTKGKIIIGNNGHEDIFGQNLKLLTGKKISEIFQNSSDIDNDDLNIIKNKVRSEKIKKMYLKNSQKAMWIKINKSPIFDENNNVCAIVVAMINYDKFIEREEKKDTFVATITHDLKTPTNAQIRALDLLLNDKFGQLQQKQREIITEIKNSCKYMSGLIFSILDTYSSENTNFKMKFEEFSLTKLVEECAAEISYLSIEKNQKLSLVFPQDELIIKADRTQIKRVIINLVANAIYYGRNNTVIEVCIANCHDAVFSVKNHSAYIPKEKLNTLFEKYRTGFDPKIQKCGTGLGLYLSKQIVINHQGKIHADSSPDNICTFSFSIPKNLKEEEFPAIEMVS